jgi:molybdopterin-containing oxidoreductase family iron-sulfur binding subunit
MEKCTYCIQRIRTTQINPDREDRPVRDGEIQTPCQQSCPTQAIIIFGNRNDPQSAVAHRKASPLDFVLLEELYTRPRTSYAAVICNPNPAIESGKA